MGDNPMHSIGTHTRRNLNVMRFLACLALFALAGCGVVKPISQVAPAYTSTSAAAAQTPEQQAARNAQQARADSLLTLPPDSLSSAELTWLQVYQQSRETETQASSGGVSAETVGYTVALVATILGGIYFLTTRD